MRIRRFDGRPLVQSLGDPAATTLLDNISDDVLTGFGVMSDGLGAAAGRVWVFQKYWWSECWTLLIPTQNATQEAILANKNN